MFVNHCTFSFSDSKTAFGQGVGLLNQVSGLRIFRCLPYKASKRRIGHRIRSAPSQFWVGITGSALREEPYKNEGLPLYKESTCPCPPGRSTSCLQKSKCVMYDCCGDVRGGSQRGHERVPRRPAAPTPLTCARVIIYPWTYSLSIESYSVYCEGSNRKTTLTHTPQ